jgi:hypothetical protein
MVLSETAPGAGEVETITEALLFIPALWRETVDETECCPAR